MIVIGLKLLLVILYY